MFPFVLKHGDVSAIFLCIFRWMWLDRLFKDRPSLPPVFFRASWLVTEMYLVGDVDRTFATKGQIKACAWQQKRKKYGKIIWSEHLLLASARGPVIFTLHEADDPGSLASLPRPEPASGS